MNRTKIQRIIAILKGEQDPMQELEHYKGAVSLFRRALHTKQIECEQYKSVIDSAMGIDIEEEIQKEERVMTKGGSICSPYMTEMFG